MKINYFKTYQNCNSNQISEICSLFIKKCREQNKTLYVLSHKFVKNDKVWFKGFICCPNQLLQTAYWCESVLPNKSWILDFTESLDVPVLEGGIKTIMNPNRVFTNPKFLTTAYYDEI